MVESWPYNDVTKANYSHLRALKTASGEWEMSEDNCDDDDDATLSAGSHRYSGGHFSGAKRSISYILMKHD
jgi:hypothetical protein